MTEKLIRQYLRETKKSVACSAKRKRAFLAQLEAGLRELAQETDNLTPEQLTKTFGTPQQQAQSFMETLDANEVKKAFGWKKIVLVAAVAMIMIWLIGIVIVVIDGHRSANGYSVEEEYEVATDENGSYTEYHKDGYYGIMTLKDEKVRIVPVNEKNAYVLQYMVIEFRKDLAKHRDKTTLVFFHGPLNHTLLNYKKSVNTPKTIAMPADAIDAMS